MCVSVLRTSDCCPKGSAVPLLVLPKGPQSDVFLGEQLRSVAAWQWLYAAAHRPNAAVKCGGRVATPGSWQDVLSFCK